MLQYLGKMKKIVSYSLLFLSLCVFSACPSNGDDDNEDIDVSPTLKTEPTLSLYGLWSTTVTISNYKILLLSDGKMLHGNDVYSMKKCSWTYDEDKKELATTGIAKYPIGNYSDISMQWTLSIVDKNTWAGIGLWNNKAYSASRVENLKEVVVGILNYRQWKQKNNNKSIDVSCSDRSIHFGKHYFYFPSINPPVITEDRERNIIKIKQKPEDSLFIYHPYDFRNISVEGFNKELYYPVSE